MFSIKHLTTLTHEIISNSTRTEPPPTPLPMPHPTPHPNPHTPPHVCHDMKKKTMVRLWTHWPYTILTYVKTLSVLSQKTDIKHVSSKNATQYKHSIMYKRYFA